VAVDVLFVGIPVADFPSAVSWYERLWGRPAEIVVNDDEVMWKMTEGGWLYVVRDAGRAGKALAAVAVPDLDRALAELNSRGMVGAGIETVGEGARKATFTDPEGNTVSFIEVTTQ
jgi:predicted enzyme related to lactoylglutathione lyase